MADDQNPVFQIQRVYLKEASLEQPNSPAILLQQEQPSVDIQLGVEANGVADGITFQPTLSFGNEGQIVALNLNSTMPDHDGSERATLTIHGLGEHAAFYAGASLLSASYDSLTDTYTLLGLTPAQVTTLGVIQSSGDYALTVLSEILIYALFAASLHLMMAVGGLASFGHAAFLGAGAIGTYVGGSLALAGHQVTFSEQPEAAAAIAANGLQVTRAGVVHSTHDFAIFGSAAEALAAGPHDVVVCALKSFDTEAALAYDPLLVKRLRRIRSQRQRERSARRSHS